MKVDVFGDIHGCFKELCTLFEELGYEKINDLYIHPQNRIPIFVGDLTDRGPESIKVIQLVYKMVVKEKVAKYVPGNHCNKLYRFFLGNNVKQQHGLETTVAEFEALDNKMQGHVRNQFMRLYEEAPLYLQLPEVNAVIAHAGIKQSYIGRLDKKVKTFVLYGDITGEIDESGKPIRRDWAQHYRGNNWIVYGHTPVLNPRIVNKTINIDTGCVFGNKLTAFRLPEENIVSVPSLQPFNEEKFRSFPDA
ncbi:bis(5'-nucleosyl)-tetraphosphatase PrpE [Ornithinibacillus sp. 179-J 7C1 HS]|uniref:bis(5'-nucleosyl)-tetraphosphatase PrpE n=1 Tax=Ornithinibacillus sp. 179-J 7C1 HS TaxID=3142384 RepID=UPI0039A05791